jgi:hypothetical protein
MGRLDIGHSAPQLEREKWTMSWREAFLEQARSDNRIRRLLNQPQVEYCHRLHYLQMVTEKLAKAMLAAPEATDPPKMVHHALVRMLQTLKGRPDLRARLGYSDANIFRAFIDSILDLADQIESLAPSAAGFMQPNPEYPWRRAQDNFVITPAAYPFPLFNPRNPKMIKFEKLLGALLSVAG